MSIGHRVDVLPRKGTVSHRDRSGLDGPTRQTAEYHEPTQRKWGELIEHFGQGWSGSPAVLPQTLGSAQC